MQPDIFKQRSTDAKIKVLITTFILLVVRSP